MQPILRFLGRIVDASTLIGAVAVVLMMLHISVDVVAKYIFGVPMPGTITAVSNYYMIVVAFLPLAFTERRNTQISVEVATVHMPGGVQRGLNLFSLVICTVIFAAMTWQGLIEAGRAQSIGTFEIEYDVKLITWPARYVLPLGCGLITLTLLAKLAVALRRGRGLDLEKPYF